MRTKKVGTATDWGFDGADAWVMYRGKLPDYYITKEEAKAFKENGGLFTTIEYYDKRQSVAIENFTKCGVVDIVSIVVEPLLEIILSFEFK